MIRRTILTILLAVASFVAAQLVASAAVHELSAGAYSARRCAPSAEVGCLDRGRFQVEVIWQNPFDGSSGRGVMVAAASTDETLAISFGDPANIELLVKILESGNSVKLYYGELTDLPFQLIVTDTAHEKTRVYGNTPGDCGRIDGAGFSIAAAASRRLSHATAAACRPSPATLCLLGGRFAASVTWHNQFDGTSGFGHAGRLSNLTGSFYFTDPGDQELLVKILDLGDRTAVFYGSLSNLEFELTVTDNRTGVTKSYENPAGGSIRGGRDDDFPTS